ncbi:uncharacterized protein [Medicago truncatula]|uniref:uncharacterized protein n=1 Tax=Medicago truncatula TaxID=3880 RepID=UPI0019677242|nr:uncharacterized protein LOC120579599 [Medicago truncatula]
MASSEAPTQPSAEASTQDSQTQRNVRAKTDIAWGHAKIVLDGEKEKPQCIYCNKVIKGGGINRLKLHLAGETGQVEACSQAPEEVRFKMKQNREETRLKKRKTEHAIGNEEIGNEEQTQRGQPRCRSVVVASQKGTNNGSFDNYFLPRTTPGSQPTIKSVLQTKEVVEKCDLSLAKWFIAASIPFNAANSPYFQSAVDALCCMGAGYKAPSIHDLRGPLLNKWVDETKKKIEKYREIWKTTGCTLMADGWTDGEQFFIKSVDASGASKTSEMLFKLFKEVVLYIGPENVVHIVTDNAANYVAAGRLLEKEFPGLYWSPCAAHCINLMFQDIGKLPEVKEAVSHATNVTKYIYNHCYPLYLMRKFTHGREILRPAPTRFASNFIALQSILSQKNALRAMVTSQEWTTSAYAKEAKAKQFVEQVLNTNFWTACADIVKLTEPLVGVLRLVDSEDKPSMGFLYRNMYKAREEMVKRFQRNKTKVEPYLKIIDDRWDSQLRKNLHAAGYWLNPSCRFSPEFEKHKSTTSGLIDVIEKYARNNHELRAKLNTETSIFRNSEGDFGRKSAIEARNSPFPGILHFIMNGGNFTDVKHHICKNWQFGF